MLGNTLEKENHPRKSPPQAEPMTTLKNGEKI